jgi:hypothetical protein
MKERGSSIHLAIRITLLVAEEWRAETSLAALRDKVVERFGVSRATAYRHLAIVIDEMKITVEVRPLDSGVGQRFNLLRNSSAATHPWRRLGYVSKSGRGNARHP